MDHCPAGVYGGRVAALNWARHVWCWFLLFFFVLFFFFISWIAFSLTHRLCALCSSKMKSLRRFRVLGSFALPPTPAPPAWVTVGKR